VNPWQRERRRRNGLLFIIVASLLVFLLLVLNRVGGVIPFETGGQTAAAASVPDEKPTDLRAAKKKPTRTHSGAVAQPGTQPDLDQLIPVQVPTDGATSVHEPASLKRSVKNEPTLVYSSNTPRSSVVEELKKGDQVETNLEVMDSHGRWSLVRANGQNQSGFVRTEDLERLKAEQK